MRRDHFDGAGHACDRNVRFDADGDFEFESQPTEIRALHGRTRSMDAPGKHDTRDRMIDPAKGLHRSRRKPDLVAHGVAVFVAEKRYVSLLDIVGVRDGRGPVRRTKRPEPYIGLVFGEQCFGRAPGRDILHRSSPFSPILVPGITNRYCSPSFETATEPVIGRAFARPVGGLLRMRSNLLKHNNLMLRSERRERLEAWAAGDSPISHSRYLARHGLPSKDSGTFLRRGFWPAVGGYGEG